MLICETEINQSFEDFKDNANISGSNVLHEAQTILGLVNSTS